MSQRIKGQESEISMVVDGAVMSSTTTIRSLEIAAKTEIKEEGYLGETTNRYDEIFNGVRGHIEGHMETKQVFDIMMAIIDRARRRTPGVKINIKTTLNFPNGDRPRVLLQDCFFGEQPIGFGGRSEYLTFRFEFACSDIKRI
jgi:hypothetical protein